MSRRLDWKEINGKDEQNDKWPGQAHTHTAHIIQAEEKKTKKSEQVLATGRESSSSSNLQQLQDKSAAT